jgi:hypothetical protein
MAHNKPPEEKEDGPRRNLDGAYCCVFLRLLPPHPNAVNLAELVNFAECQKIIPNIAATQFPFTQFFSLCGIDSNDMRESLLPSPRMNMAIREPGFQSWCKVLLLDAFGSLRMRQVSMVSWGDLCFTSSWPLADCFWCVGDAIQLR